MDNSIAKQFLETSAKQLEVHASRIDDCLGRLTHDQLWWRGADSQNSVANLMLHLCGNLSQSTAALVDLPDTRDREREFDQRSGLTSDELRAKLKATTSAAVSAFRTMPEARLTEVVRTKIYERPMMKAIYLRVDHFSQHAGQVLYATKLMTGHDLGYYAHLNKPKPKT
jgi:hypothetical protein